MQTLGGEEWGHVALSLVQLCVRNTELENLHAGIFPASESGDYADVKVVSPYGEIPWTNLSRISDAEMRELMIEITNKVFTYLMNIDALANVHTTRKWQIPQLDARLAATADRYRQHLPKDPT